MPWKVVKRNCKQSDGSKGTYVVVKEKSDGGTEQESCHTSEDKANAAVRARYASKNELSEPIKENIIKVTRRKLRILIMEEVERTVTEKLEDLLISDDIESFYMGANLLKTLAEYDEIGNMMGDHADPMLLNALENAVTHFKKIMKESEEMSKQLGMQEYQLKQDYRRLEKLKKLSQKSFDKPQSGFGASDIMGQLKKSLHPLPSRQEYVEMMQDNNEALQALAVRQHAERDRYFDYYKRLQVLSSLGYEGDDMSDIFLEEPGMYGGLKFGPAKDNYVYLDDPLMEVRI